MQNLDFIKRWNSIDFKVPRKEIIPKYEECPIILNNKEAFDLIDPGDKIESPTGIKFFIILDVQGKDLLTISKNGRKGIRHFSEILPTNIKYQKSKGFYKLYKLKNDCTI